MRLELAGGIDAPEPALGTDAVRVAEAIARADSGDGVLVLMDLGSAVLSAETALDLLTPEQQGRVLLGHLGRQPHQRGRREVGHVGHEGDEPVMVVGVDSHDISAQGGHHCSHPRVGRRVGRRRRREHPRRALEQLGVGALDTLLLGAGHGVTTDEAGIVDGGDDGALDAAHVGHDTPAGERRPRLTGHGRLAQQPIGPALAVIDPRQPGGYCQQCRAKLKTDRSFKMSPPPMASALLACTDEKRFNSEVHNDCKRRAEE